MVKYSKTADRSICFAIKAIVKNSCFIRARHTKIRISNA